MTIPVELIELGPAVAERGAGYLLTGSGGRPHVAHVSFTVEGAELRCEAGRSSRCHATAQPEVALLWPPMEPGGYSLIVDGRAEVVGDPTEPGAVVVATTRAVLHRPAPAAAQVGGSGDDPGCEQDCLPVELPGDPPQGR